LNADVKHATISRFNRRSSMKAAVLKAFGSPLSIETIPDPVLGTGEVIVDVVAAGVLPYAAEVISSERTYQLELPIVLGAGAVGRVRAVGPDATRLRGETGCRVTAPSGLAMMPRLLTSCCTAGLRAVRAD
jgi:NADPH:quinone reductase-like Zn-dependent oxidoreductase